jgi:hypothetical protein
VSEPDRGQADVGPTPEPEAAAPAGGTAGPMIEDTGFPRNRWAWQLLLPDLWLQEQEAYDFSELNIN